MIAFYGLNGGRLTFTNDQAYDLVMKVAAGELDQVEEISAVLQGATAPAVMIPHSGPQATRVPGQRLAAAAGSGRSRQEDPDRPDVSVANEISGSLTGSQ